MTPGELVHDVTDDQKLTAKNCHAGANRGDRPEKRRAIAPERPNAHDIAKAPTPQATIPMWRPVASVMEYQINMPMKAAIHAPENAHGNIFLAWESAALSGSRVRV